MSLSGHNNQEASPDSDTSIPHGTCPFKFQEQILRTAPCLLVFFFFFFFPTSFASFLFPRRGFGCRIAVSPDILVSKQGCSRL
ncbi:hypothetical protein I7I50_11129 [Histoplasma capsulatum G186AR]|uniref:Uncharacterized protein n=1 Tax=Ajellomyces capsulatus TaxID=5037 RepID=A0A8H7Z7U4_AJECA|nr:hypothetical protein I7I52_02368 [Histoplasma capsulatum]QSS69734.1 hypothetical protein I7I50_11129 [Histoplasma capsulatum G186AR]